MSFTSTNLYIYVMHFDHIHPVIILFPPTPPHPFPLPKWSFFYFSYFGSTPINLIVVVQRNTMRDYL